MSDIREDVAKAIADAPAISSCDCGDCCLDRADAAIAAAESHIRRQVLQELLDEAESSLSPGLVSGASVLPAFRWAKTVQWLRSKLEATP